jgi:hypothetical protein
MSEVLIAEKRAYRTSGSGLRHSANVGAGKQVSGLVFTFRHHSYSVDDSFGVTRQTSSTMDSVQHVNLANYLQSGIDFLYS